MSQDPRFIYTGVTAAQALYFGWDKHGAYKMQHKTKIAFIPGAPYIVVASEVKGVAKVSGLFKLGRKVMYHTQEIKKEICKVALQFERRYPKTKKY